MKLKQWENLNKHNNEAEGIFSVQHYFVKWRQEIHVLCLLSVLPIG